MFGVLSIIFLFGACLQYLSASSDYGFVIHLSVRLFCFFDGCVPLCGLQLFSSSRLSFSFGGSAGGGAFPCAPLLLLHRGRRAAAVSVRSFLCCPFFLPCSPFCPSSRPTSSFPLFLCRFFFGVSVCVFSFHFLSLFLIFLSLSLSISHLSLFFLFFFIFLL